VIVNFLNREELAAAIAEPEKHMDLVIRVTGYSARFVQLSPEIQEEVLLRTVY
jgi:pyruvate-formate lyase